MPLTLSYTVGFSSNEAKTIGSIRVTDTTNWAGQGINPADVEIGIGITDIVMIQQNIPSQSSVLSVQKSH